MEHINLIQQQKYMNVLNLKKNQIIIILMKIIIFILNVMKLALHA